MSSPPRCPTRSRLERLCVECPGWRPGWKRRLLNERTVARLALADLTDMVRRDVLAVLRMDSWDHRQTLAALDLYSQAFNAAMNASEVTPATPTAPVVGVA